jgi:hypothetical protein
MDHSFNKCAKGCVYILAIFILLLFATNITYGQTAAFGTITGRVVDPKGASVPDATVTAKNTETGIVRTTKTTSDGLYRFENLPPGVYDVAVESSAFTKAEANHLKLQVGEQRDVNFTLAIAGQRLSVVVTSELPLVETTRTDTSTVIDDKSVADLPTTTAFNISGTAGVNGISNDYAGLATTAPGVKYDFTSVSADLLGPGAVNDRGILVNVDGGDISDQVVSTRDALGASLEEVREFQVITNNYNAEYGQAGSVILNVVTKSGTNGFHGDAHGYFRGRNLTASTFFYNQSPQAKFRRAPFFKHEGGFTAGGPFVKDKSFWFVSYETAHQASPLTLLPPSGSITVQQPTDEFLWSAKWDHQVSSKHHLMVRYNIQRDKNNNYSVQLPTIRATPEVLNSFLVHDNNLNVGVVSTPTPNTVNEARFFWHRYLNSLLDLSTLPGQRGPNFYHGAAFCCPQGGIQNRYQWVDNLSWTHGSHTIKTGFNISHFPYNSLFQQFHFGEWENFGTNGLPGQFTIAAGPGFVQTSDNIYGLYVQDSWQIRHNLTINYGLRYDLENGAFTGGTKPNQTGGGCFQGNGIISACSKDHNNWQPRLGIAWSPSFESGIFHSLFGSPGRSVVRMSFAEVTELAFLNVSLDSLNFDGLNLLTATTTDPTVLAFFPNRPPDSVLAPFFPASPTFFGRVRPIAPNLHNPETRHANLTVSRQIGPSFVVEAGYLGVFGFGLFGERDTNFPALTPDPNHPGFFYFALAPSIQPLNPPTARPDNRFIAVRTNSSSRTSAFHGFTVRATKRLSHHLQFQGGYVFSKTLSTTEDFFGLSELGNPLASPSLDRAPAQNDIRHQGNFSVVLDSEKLFGNALVGSMMNNWTIGFIGQLQSGRPYPISTGDGPFVGSIFPAVGVETQQRPNVLADGTIVLSGNIASNSGVSLLVGPNGAAQCNCPQTTFLAPSGADKVHGPVDSFTGDPVDFQLINGNLARNAGLTSPYYRFDLSLLKAIPLPREGMRLELKVDIFNVFNRPNFLLYNGADVVAGVLPFGAAGCTSCVENTTGRIIGVDGRALNIANLRGGPADSNFGAPNWGGIGDPTLTDLPRTIQLAVRFRW